MKQGLRNNLSTALIFLGSLNLVEVRVFAANPPPPDLALQWKSEAQNFLDQKPSGEEIRKFIETPMAWPTSRFDIQNSRSFLITWNEFVSKALSSSSSHPASSASDWIDRAAFQTLNHWKFRKSRYLNVYHSMDSFFELHPNSDEILKYILLIGEWDFDILDVRDPKRSFIISSMPTDESKGPSAILELRELMKHESSRVGSILALFEHMNAKHPSGYANLDQHRLPELYAHEGSGLYSAGRFQLTDSELTYLTKQTKHWTRYIWKRIFSRILQTEGAISFEDYNRLIKAFSMRERFLDFDVSFKTATSDPKRITIVPKGRISSCIRSIVGLLRK